MRRARTIIAAWLITASAAAAMAFGAVAGSTDVPPARDPGPRNDTATSAHLAGLTANELQFFVTGEVEFAEAEGAADGLGPRMNLDHCSGCHAHPRSGGSSPRPRRTPSQPRRTP